MTLPDGQDPAEWLTRDGDAGLVAFTRNGCLDDHEHVRAQPAGALLARHELDRAMELARRHNPNAETFMVAPAVTQRLGTIAANLPNQAAARRFADSAGAELAQLVDGVSPRARAGAILDAARAHHQSDRPLQAPEIEPVAVSP